MANYKYCLVPMCRNSTATTPHKVFFHVPNDPVIRKKWCDAMKRDPKKNKPLSSKSNRHVCEDHFELETDMENYTRYKLQGGRKFLKPGVMPHVFDCQKTKVTPPPRERSIKRQRKEMVEEILNASVQPTSPVDQSLDASDEDLENETPIELICGVHFTEDQFENHRADNRRLLKRTAVPSIFGHQALKKSKKLCTKNKDCSKTTKVEDVSSDHVLEINHLVSAGTSEFKDVQSNNIPGEDQVFAYTPKLEIVEPDVVLGDDQVPAYPIKLTVAEPVDLGNDQVPAYTPKLEIAEPDAVLGNDQVHAYTPKLEVAEPDAVLGNDQVPAHPTKLTIAKPDVVLGNDQVPAYPPKLEIAEPDAVLGNNQVPAYPIKLAIAEPVVVLGYHQVPACPIKLAFAEPNNAPGPDPYLKGDKIPPSSGDCSFNKESKEKIEDLKRKLNLLHKKIRQKDNELQNLEHNLSVLFTQDQIHYLRKGLNTKKKEWDDETIEKARGIYLSCHKKGYNYLKEIGYPLPSIRTVQRKNLSVKPGVS